MSVRRVGAAAGTPAPSGSRPRRVAKDVYPDPEPDPELDKLLERIEANKARGLPATLRMHLDDQGRLVDELGRHIGADGKVVQPPGAPGAADEELDEDEQKYYDKAIARNKRRDRGGFDFHGAGETKYTAQADRMRELAERRSALKARKGGAVDGAVAAAAAAAVAEATPVEVADAAKGAELLEVPEIEWWDALLLPEKSYAKLPADGTPEAAEGDAMKWGAKIKSLGLVEHPVPVLGPNVAAPLPPQPLMLTKKERKRRRTDARVAREKDKQEQIALGLMQPPPPKVRISNMMKVMGTEAVQDPTLIEKFVREEEMARVARHEARNAERKLAPDDRRTKKREKNQAAADDDPMTTVYRIKKLTSNQDIWKITENAKQHHLSGFLVTTESGVNMVLIEGGPRPTRKYTHLVLNRIKYTVDAGDDPATNASVVWQGYSGKKKMFDNFRHLTFASDDKAKKYMTNQECSQYWDMLISGRELGEMATTDDLL